MSSRIPKMEVTIDNVRFKEVPDKRQGVKIGSILTLSNVKMSESVADYINNPDDRFYTLVNAVDIDWNAVVVDENLELHTTSDLIKWIKSLAGGGIDPSNYYDKAEIDAKVTELNQADTDINNAIGTDSTPNTIKGRIKSIEDSYVSDSNLSDYTYDKATIDEKVAQGGTFDPEQYYNKQDTDQLLNAKADSNSLSNVATSGSYNDLSDKPTIPDALVQADWNEANASNKSYIKNKPNIPAVPTNVSAFTNDSGYLVASDIAGKADKADTYTKAEVDASQSAQDTVIATKAPQATTYTKTEVNNLLSPKANSADLATVATSGSYTDLADKPTIPDAQIQADWNQTTTTAKDYIKNKPTVPTKTSELVNDSSFITSSDIPEGAAASNTMPKEDGNASTGSELAFARGDHRHPHDSTKADISSLANVATSGSYNDLNDKPNIPDAQIQSDWNQTTTTAKDYIKNKPTLATVATSGSFADLTNKPTYTKNDVGLGNVLNVEQIPATDKGVAGGVATLDSTGKVPSSQLPSYVDDIIEAASRSAFPTPGEAGKIYVAKDTNKEYRWGGSDYVIISETLAIGETSSTAFAGDRGKAVEDKLATIANGAEVNVQSDWTESDSTKDSYIQHKPTIPTKTSELTNDSDFITSADIPEGAAASSTTPLMDGVASVGSETRFARGDHKHPSDTSKANTSDLETLFDNIGYIQQGKRLIFYHGDTALKELDCSVFVKDGMIDTVEVKNAVVGGETVKCVVFTFNTDAAKSPIAVPVSDIINAANLATVATTGAYSDLSGTPNFATVATSGSYNDLSNKPSIPAAQVLSDWNASSGMGAILNKPTLGAAATKGVTDNTTATAVTSTDDNLITARTLYNAGYTKNTGTITGVNMNGASKGTSGIVDLGTVITSHQDISGKADKSATVSTVTYDTTNKKITKTINGTTSDVVTTAKLKTDMNLTSSDVGLGNVNNTSDADKPISTATLNALNSKVDNTITVNRHALSSNVTVTKSDVGLGNVGNFKAVSTEASQGLTDTEKDNARTNIGAGTYSKPSDGIPNTDFTRELQDTLLVNSLSAEPIVGLSTYELLEGTDYGLMQSVVATDSYIIGFIGKEKLVNNTWYNDYIISVLFDYNGNYLGRSIINAEYHCNDATIVGDYIYICNSGNGGTGVIKVNTQTLITNCINKTTTSYTSITNTDIVSLDYDSQSDDICVWYGDSLCIYNSDLSTLKKTAVTDVIGKIINKFGSYLNSYVIQGLVYKNNKAYVIGVGDLTANVNCSLMSIFDLDSGDIVDVYKIPSFSSFIEIQGSFKSPLRDDEILASYNIWGHGNCSTILGVLRISLSGHISSPVNSIKVENPTFDEVNSVRTVYVDNSETNTGPSVGTMNAPFKRIEDVYSLLSNSTNIEILLANTNKTYHVFDSIYLRNSTLRISTWSKYDNNIGKATLSAVFVVNHSQLKLERLELTISSDYTYYSGGVNAFDFDSSLVDIRNCTLSNNVKSNMFFCRNTKALIGTNCALTCSDTMWYLDGNNEINFVNIDNAQMNISGTQFVRAVTNDKVYFDIRYVNSFSSISSYLVASSYNTEPVIHISNVYETSTANKLKVSCVSGSSKGAIAIHQDTNYGTLFNSGLFTNDSSFGTVSGLIFYERSTGIPFLYRKKGTTDERDAMDLSGYTGRDALPYINTTTGKVEFWNGSVWV